MMENSASPLPEATAPITAVEPETSPATGACTCVVPPSGSVSFASAWPEVTVSPASTMISETFSPGRSGRTAVSCRGMMMPVASTIEEKQDFLAVSTVTAAPFGASGSSAASAGCAAARATMPAASAASSFRENFGAAKRCIGVPFPFQASSIPERRRQRQAADPFSLSPLAGRGSGRGESPRAPMVVICGSSPSPLPLPAKSGERESCSTATAPKIPPRAGADLQL